ncbi:MAG TPA: metallophosphoesterase [Alphaproteobacteria bacterium]|nr:metallophosphoesterase [Alphaproteobacteria bacterium]
MHLLAISDVHTDFQENRLLLEQIPDTQHRDDALIVAGDISDRYAIIAATLAFFRAKFRHVFYVPGNHELWVRKEPYTSVDKFRRILDLCDTLGVHTRPAKIEGVWIVPLLSWYQASFDTENSGDATTLDGWADFHCCRWPGRVTDVAEFFLALNQPHLKSYDGPVVSFSHFLPRRDLLPAIDRLRFKGLPKVAGCAELDRQIRQINASIHVFGHSHISCDRVIDGVRYVQNPLKYPRERLFSGLPLKTIAAVNGEEIKAAEEA